MPAVSTLTMTTRTLVITYAHIPFLGLPEEAPKRRRRRWRGPQCDAHGTACGAAQVDATKLMDDVWVYAVANLDAHMARSLEVSWSMLNCVSVL